MESPGVLARHPALRWLVPMAVGTVAAAAVLAASGVLTERPSVTELPETAPGRLVTALHENRNLGFSGTVVSHVSLGLPTLPSVPALAGMDEETSFRSLLSGSHTMQVWYGGPDKQRVALLGASQETDLVRNGRDLWQWSSADGVARHTVLAHPSVARPQPAEALTPRTLAEGALGSLDPHTDLRMADEASVAGRPVYELVITPHAVRTKIGSVHLAIDGATKVPLGVQVFAKDSPEAAIDVAFTSIRFGMPADRNFEFSPPPNATVTEAVGEQATDYAPAAVAVLSGEGWAAVHRLAPVRMRRAGPTTAAEFHLMPTVSGQWGKGRLLESELLSVLVTSDGRVYAGAVPPRELYAAAAHR